VKLQIYLSQGVDYKDHTEPGSSLLEEFEKTSFVRVSIHLYVGLLYLSEDLRTVSLPNGSLRVKLRRDGAGWERSFRLGGIAVWEPQGEA
jgi:hypothetical protein